MSDFKNLLNTDAVPLPDGQSKADLLAQADKALADFSALNSGAGGGGDSPNYEGAKLGDLSLVFPTTCFSFMSWSQIHLG